MYVLLFLMFSPFQIFEQSLIRFSGQIPQPVKGRRLEFDGVPFMLIGTAVYDCHQGRDKNTALKARVKKEKEKVKQRNKQLSK